MNIMKRVGNKKKSEKNCINFILQRENEKKTRKNERQQ